MLEKSYIIGLARKISLVQFRGFNGTRSIMYGFRNGVRSSWMLCIGRGGTES